MIKKRWLILSSVLIVISTSSVVWAACTDVCLDFDGDGFGNPASSVCLNSGLDCDDTNPTITTGITEDSFNGNCGDGLDNDCDGMIDCSDLSCFTAVNCLAVLPVCSDGTCDAGENCNNCWSDCSTWGNSICDVGCDECPGGVNENLVECGCGNGTVECGEECDGISGVTPGFTCNASCVLVPVSACIDGDGDGFDGYNAISCLLGTDCNDLNPLINSSVSEQCDAIDWDCDGDEVNGFSLENCDRVCGLSGFNWTGNSGLLNCCGNDVGEASPYEVSEITCDGVSDNDCDGIPDATDPDCTGICNNTGENDWINAVTPGDCDQCDFEGDDDGDQTLAAENWTPYPGMVDACDADCGAVAVTVQLADYESIEASCSDGIDNDCDGIVDAGPGCTNVCTFPITLPCVFP